MNKEKVEPMVVDKNGYIYFSAIEYYKDINELKQRIDKAIEYIETTNKLFLTTKRQEVFDDLLDILRGKNE